MSGAKSESGCTTLSPSAHSHLDFFGLSASPFRQHSSAFSLFSNTTLHAASERINAALDHPDGGLIVVTGAAGAGKTTLVNDLVERRKNRSVVTKLDHITPNESAFLAHLLASVGQPLEPHEHRSPLDVFHDFLLAKEWAKQPVILVIDEAQALTPEMLDWLPRLMTLQSGMTTRFSILLAGQEAFSRTLTLHVSADFRALVRAQLYLSALDLADTSAYLQHQLTVAGNPTPLFTESAITLIHQQTGGSLRRINTLCDFVLFNAFQRRAPRITPELVQTTLTALHWQPIGPSAHDAASDAESGAQLILEFNHNAVFPLTKSTITIGRAADNDLCIRDLRISRYHARLTTLPQGITIEDLGSTNGVFVNQERITEQLLQDGDRIAIDTQRMRFTQRGILTR